jgi:acetylornithine/succinyldiaminopimelate/putrescine aminotransferase/predicted amino acid dehydrogenase
MDKHQLPLDLTVDQKREVLHRMLSAVASEADGRHLYGVYGNPYLVSLLEAVRMDKRFVRGDGAYLYDDEGRQYIDFTAAYGALPFGFNPNEIWEAVAEVRASGEPSFTQPSALPAAGELMRRLVELGPRGLRHVTLVNSGAESIEAAIKMARAATGRMGILSTHNAFHGKTLGALSATGRPLYQAAFGAPAPGFEHIVYGDIAALEQTLATRADEFAAFLLEPIQGEGGVNEPPAGYLSAVRECCTRHGILLILDEVQTGLGRTGTLFACDREQVVPDILTIAKALGGGLMPIGAVLSRAECYTEEFALKHTSTFANNALACRVALRALEMITRDGMKLVKDVARNGNYLKAGLERLRRRHPGLIRSIRGRGYLLGVEFTTDAAGFGRQSLIASMAEQKSLVLALCSYLLNVEGIRLAPTVFGSHVLRVEPPLIATREMCDRFLDAFGRSLVILEECDTSRMLSHLVDSKRKTASTPAVPRRTFPSATDTDAASRWAFIVHPLDLQSYRDFDVKLAEFSDAELGPLISSLKSCRYVGIDAPMIVGAARITSPTGATAFGEMIAVPYTADELMEMSGSEATHYIREAVMVGKERGARLVGLGAYTSIVTRNGAALSDAGVPLTTGNGFTAVASVDSLKMCADVTGIDLSRSTTAIVGAGGSIGRAVSILLAPQVARLVLVGSPAHPERSLNRLASVAADAVQCVQQMARAGTRFERGTIGDAILNGDCESVVENLIRSGRLVLTTEQSAYLRQAEVVITATSSTRGLINEESLREGSIVLDISRPSNVSAGLADRRPDITIVEGGLIQLPLGQELGFSIGLEPGLIYACMAETMLLSLDRRQQSGSIGTDLSTELLSQLSLLSRKHEFRVAGPSRSEGGIASGHGLRSSTLELKTR